MTHAPSTGGTDTLSLLHLDTGEPIIDRVEGLLEREVGSVTVETVSTAEQALDRLDADEFDCVVSGTDVTGMDSLGFLERVREEYPDVPFVFYETDADNEYVAQAISIGANDVIQQGKEADYAEVLAHRVENLVEQYRTQQRLEESHRRFETLVGNLPGMVYRCEYEPGWPMVFVSEGCGELTGYEPGELVDGDVSYGEDVIAEDDRERVWQIVSEAVEEDEPYQCDYRIVTADGERRWVWEQGRAVTADGEVVALEGFVTDVSERKRQRQRVNVLNRVLRHNLRNRMSVVLSHAGQLAERIDDGSVHTEKIRETARSVADLSDTVGDIEDILQTSPGDCHPMDLTATVERVAETMRSEYPDAAVTVELSEEQWVLATDRLHLALEETLDNALAHNDSDDPTATVRVADEDGEYVPLQVVDDGPGIEEEELNALDAREEITDLAHGSGLGLWVMKWYADAIDGDISFDERDPTGTAVTFYLPQADGPEGGPPDHLNAL